MIENEYAALLQHDTIKMRHPSKKDSVVTLYRIISTKSFKLTKFNKNVEKYDIGGYVESIDNLDPTNPVWIDHSGRVFDDAKILNGSYIRNVALIYENAKVDSSEVSDHCRVHGNSIVENSTLSSMAECKDNSVIKNNSKIKNSSKIYGDAVIDNSTFKVAATALGKCIVKDSSISDICLIDGDAEISNCHYNGRVIRKTGIHRNETLTSEVKLEIHEEVDESTHKEYQI